MRRLAWAALLLAAGCGSSGRYYSLHTMMRTRADFLSTPEVVSTPTGQTLTSRAQTIGLRPPDHCTGESSSEVHGDGTEALVAALIQRQNTTSEIENEDVAEIVGMRCGPIMAELERAFVREGYQVIHWSALRARAAATNSTPETVAQELGITLLVSVSSLERTRSIAALRAEWKREYVHADAYGREGQRAVVQASLADAMDAFLRQQEESVEQEIFPTVTVDITTQHLPSGESVWFYRWTNSRAQRVERRLARQYLTVCGRRGGTFFCTAVTPRATRSAAERPPRSESREEIELEQPGAVGLRTIHAELVRQAMRDVALRFRHGADASPSEPAPPIPATPPAARPTPTAPSPAPAPPASSPTPTPAPAPTVGEETPSWLREG